METGVVFEEGVCFKNRSAGPGGCLYPKPEPTTSTALALQLHLMTQWSCVFRGMDGEPAWPLWSEIEAAAHALGIPWDQTTMLQRLQIFAAWRETLPKPKS